MWRVWFSSSLLWDGVYKLERFSLEQGIIFQETDQWMTRKTGNYHSKIQKNQMVLFWLDFASDLSSFWKTATQGQGGSGEFSLVWGRKIQLNQLWQRLRVSGCQGYIPNQKCLKQPPPSLHPRGLSIARRVVFYKHTSIFFVILSFSRQDLFNEALGNHAANVSLHGAHDCRMIITD